MQRRKKMFVGLIKSMLILITFLLFVFVLNINTDTGINAQENTASGVWKEREKILQLPPESTNRPIRNRRDLVLTIGQNEGDLQGNDDKIIQAGIEYLHGIGGGTIHIYPGIYNLRNFIYLRPNITIRGSGEKTVLRKTASVVTPLVRDSDWYEYGVQVKDPTGFVKGGGIMLRSKRENGGFDVLRATVTDIQGDVIYFDQRTEKNFWINKNAEATTILPILYAENIDDVRIEDIVLDGNREENGNMNGNYAGGVFIQYCNRWSFKNVISRNYNGDGYSWQVCDDIHLENCKSLNNAGLGFHPGSGSQRPVLRNCIAKGNDLGLFFCWGVSDGLAENCTFAENRKYGISIGHRDTDNIIAGCTIESNGEVGILFRKGGDSEFHDGHRNLITDCSIRYNGGEKEGIGIDIQWRTKDITIRNNRIENKNGKEQKIGIRISKDAGRINLEGNTFADCSVEVEDLR